MRIAHNKTAGFPNRKACHSDSIINARLKYPITKTLILDSVKASHWGVQTNTIDIHAVAEDFAFERLLTADEAIKLIPIHVNTLRLWARQGKIPCYRIGRRVVFRASDLNRWLEAPCYAGHAVLTASTYEREAA